VENIWDYRRELPAIAETTLTVAPGEDRRVEWSPACTGLADGYVRLDVESDSADVLWRYSSTVPPGQVAGWAMSPKKLRRMASGVSMAFGISPPQAAYEPAQVLTGVTRPHRATNLWRSDPGQPLPQWLQLEWRAPQSISQIELTFPGHLLRELHAYPPFYRDPQTARDYRIEGWIDNAWVELHVEKGNYQRQRRHVLANAVATTQLRVVFDATNGDPCAALYEIRAYA
jgi:hypothetical protein